MTQVQKDRTYSRYLDTAHFQGVRIDALARAGYKCQVCASVHALSVHHNTYENLTCEQPEDVFVLCATCHDLFHSMSRLAGRALTQVDYSLLLEFIESNAEPTPTDAVEPDAQPRCMNCGRQLRWGNLCGKTCERRLAERNARGY